MILFSIGTGLWSQTMALPPYVWRDTTWLEEGSVAIRPGSEGKGGAAEPAETEARQFADAVFRRTRARDAGFEQTRAVW
ncbi:MAG: hypothetical protein LAQ30_15090, partial [Acidobacteriia bacterium]|nr:hypothetical protein [Terriglobia bacterium]